MRKWKLVVESVESFLSASVQHFSTSISVQLLMLCSTLEECKFETKLVQKCC